MKPWYTFKCIIHRFRSIPIAAAVILFSATLADGAERERERERNRTFVRPSQTVSPRLSDLNVRVHTNAQSIPHRISGGNARPAGATQSDEILYVFQRFAFGAWQDVERVYIVRDNAGRIIEDVLQVYDNNNWVDEDRFLYEYEGDSFLPSILTWQEWNAGESAWENIERELYQYDGEGREVEIIYEDWFDGVWDPYDRVEITYTDDGEYLFIVWSYWWGDSWEAEYRSRWEYDEGILTEKVDEFWDGVEWWEESRVLYEHESGFLIGELWQEYDEDEEEWEDTQRQIYTNDGSGNRIESVLQFVFDDEWMNMTRSLFAYNGGGNMVSHVDQAWDGEDWLNVQRQRYEYDGSGELLVWYFDDWSNEEWRAAERFLFGGTGVVNIAEDGNALPLRFELMQNYPNPFNPSTTISFSIPVETHIRLSVYDMLGRVIAVLIDADMHTGTHHHVFDAGDLASGVYLYRLRAGDRVETKRLVLIR